MVVASCPCSCMCHKPGLESRHIVACCANSYRKWVNGGWEQRSTLPPPGLLLEGTITDLKPDLDSTSFTITIRGISEEDWDVLAESMGFLIECMNRHRRVRLEVRP